MPKGVYISAKLALMGAILALIGAFIRKSKYDELTAKVAFNHGKEITTKDEKGKYYVIVLRGGKVDLTLDYKHYFKY